jgi:DNA-dependent metalloprotease WSS1
MVRRRWTVPLLEEFFPLNANLLGLNVNSGEKIRIRLRMPRDKLCFYDYDSVLHTLLHELVHIEIGPHDAPFYSMLDELVLEASKLHDPGSSGRVAAGPNAFAVAGTGTRLGDWSSKTVPRRDAAAAAAEAAQRRFQKQRIMGTGVLGGETKNIHLVCDPREMALAAAERRRKDDVWCQRASSVPEEAGRRVQNNNALPVEIIDLETTGDPKVLFRERGISLEEEEVTWLS